MLHCLLNSAVWCSRKKHVGPAFVFYAFQTHNLVGPMNNNLHFFFVTKHYCIYILSKTQTQQRRQTLSQSQANLTSLIQSVQQLLRTKLNT